MKYVDNMNDSIRQGLIFPSMDLTLEIIDLCLNNIRDKKSLCGSVFNRDKAVKQLHKSKKKLKLFESTKTTRHIPI